MNELDLQLYKLFARKELTEGCLCGYKLSKNTNDITYSILKSKNGTYMGIGPSEILGHEPQLHDVFRVAKGKDYVLIINNSSNNLECFTNIWVYIPYNATESLLNQSDETKQSLIKLFEN